MVPVLITLKGNMQNQYKLAERAVLMRMSAGMPGKHRKDRELSDQVKTDKGLGAHAGGWIKNKFPDWALQPLEKLVNEARAYHGAVTLPFDNGIGILPAALIVEYGDRMRDFAGQFANLKESHFRAKYPEMVEWAKREHNGTFDASDYPEVEEVMKSFYFKTEPLPVPDAAHFENTVKSLMGVDTEAVTIRVQDAMQEAQKELMRRLIEPVRAMAEKLAEPIIQKPNKKGVIVDKQPVFRDSLIGNLQEIAKLAPKLNIAGDPAIDAFVTEIDALARVPLDHLRESNVTRSATAVAAKAVLAKLEGYKL